MQVALVRKGLNSMQSITIGALIVIDVHAKDIVQRLWDEEVSSVEAFEWIAQLRYYWRDDNCWTQCVQTDFPYGNEYLGNTSRLVITPLTDMAYMTLMGAQQLNLGRRTARNQLFLYSSSHRNIKSTYLHFSCFEQTLIILLDCGLRCRRVTGRPCRNRKDRNHEGLGESFGNPVCRF